MKDCDPSIFGEEVAVYPDSTTEHIPVSGYTVDHLVEDVMVRRNINETTEITMKKNDKVWWYKDHQIHRVVGTTTVTVGERQLVKVKIRRFFTTKEVFHDELVACKRASDNPILGFFMGR